MKSESGIWFMFWVWITILTGGSLSLVPGSWLTKIIFPIFLISESGPLYSPGAYRNGILQFTGELWEHGSRPRVFGIFTSEVIIATV